MCRHTNTCRSCAPPPPRPAHRPCNHTSVGAQSAWGARPPNRQHVLAYTAPVPSLPLSICACISHTRIHSRNDGARAKRIGMAHTRRCSCACASCFFAGTRASAQESPQLMLARCLSLGRVCSEVGLRSLHAPESLLTPTLWRWHCDATGTTPRPRSASRSAVALACSAAGGLSREELLVPRPEGRG